MDISLILLSILASLFMLGVISRWYSTNHDEINTSILVAYGLGGGVSAISTFLFCWWYATYKYDWFLGIAFGWVPSAIIAALAGFLWPFIVIPAAYFIFMEAHGDYSYQHTTAIIEQHVPR